MKPNETINPQTVRMGRTSDLRLGPASERQITRIKPMRNIAPRLRNEIWSVEPLPTEIRLNQLAINSDTNNRCNTITRVLKNID